MTQTLVVALGAVLLIALLVVGIALLGRFPRKPPTSIGSSRGGGGRTQDDPERPGERRAE